MSWPAFIQFARTGIRLAACLALMALAGCATHDRPSLTAASRASFRSRAEARFARVVYLKPSPTNNVPPQASQFAPLLLQEVITDDLPCDLPAGSPRPEMRCATNCITINGRSHEQMTYWWRYPKSSHRSHRGLRAQGVRITLDSAGRPVIWEVLADTSGAKLIFVSQNLEAQAAREFGAPLEGRKFAVERSLAEAPNVVVARVIEDGPMPMGPIIYLRAETRDVTTVICRCMDAQADELAGQQEYELVHVPSGAAHLRALASVQQTLRLPKDF